MEETTEENIRQGMAVLATFGCTAAEAVRPAMSDTTEPRPVSPDPKYRLSASPNTGNVLLQNCERCGCAVVDRETHTEWHAEQCRELALLERRLAGLRREANIMAREMGLTDADFGRP